jgi:chloramphenicol 3-O-phosphotransferase
MLRRAATALARRAATAASEASSSAPSTSSSSSARQALPTQQQRRAAHDLHVKNNKHVEQWMTRREDFEKEFAWDARRTVAALALVVGVPAAIYRAVVHQAHVDDEFAGRPQRDFLW